MNPGEAISIRKPDLCFVAAVASRTVSLATSHQQVLFGSMESIFRRAVVALQRGRAQGMVGVGIRGVMVVMAVVRPMAVI